MTVFVDTSAFVALALARDAQHETALATWHKLEEERCPLLTTDWVFGETVSFVRRRAGYTAARTLGERLRMSRVLDIAHADDAIVARGWEAFLAHRFDHLSLVDAVSFVMMRTRRVRRVFSFDRHFSEAGFDRIG